MASELVSNVVVLSLTAALFWGISPVFAKRGLAASGNFLLVTLCTACFGVALLFGSLLVLDGPRNVFSALSLAHLSIFLVGGLVGTTIGRLAHYMGIHRVGASIENAAVNSHPMWASVIAFVFLGEPIRSPEAIGMVVIVSGLVALSLSKGGDIGGWQRRDLIYPLVAALAFGGGNVIRRYGFVVTPATPLEGAALNALAATGGILGFMIVTGNLQAVRAPRRAYLYFAVVGLFVPLGTLALMSALSVGRVVVVTPLAGTAPLFTTFFAIILLGDLERITWGILAGVVLVIFGIVVLSFG